MLITTTAELQEYLHVAGSFNISAVLPYVRTAQIQHVEPALSSAFVTELEGDYAGAGLPVALRADLQDAIANLAFYEAIPQLQLNVDAMGLTISSTEQRKTPWQWQIDDLRRSYAERGFAALERLLATLEDDPSTYSTWASSAAYTRSRELLLTDTATMNQHVEIGHSRRLFRALMPSIRAVEKFYVRSALKPAAYNTLITAWVDRTASTEELELIELLQPAIANHAIAQALPTLRLQVTASGIALPGVEQNSDAVRKKASASMRDTEQLTQHYRDQGQAHMAVALDYLAETAAESGPFAEYWSSHPEVFRRKDDDPQPGEYPAGPTFFL